MTNTAPSDTLVPNYPLTFPTMSDEQNVAPEAAVPVEPVVEAAPEVAVEAPVEAEAAPEVVEAPVTEAAPDAEPTA